MTEQTFQFQIPHQSHKGNEGFLKTDLAAIAAQVLELNVHLNTNELAVITQLIGLHIMI